MFQTGRKAYADLIDVAQRNFKAKDSPETSPNRINKGCRRKITQKHLEKYSLPVKDLPRGVPDVQLRVTQAENY